MSSDEKRISTVLLLGSDDASAADIIDNAIAIISKSVGDVVTISERYHSEAYGFNSDRGFINRAVEVLTELDAYELLRRINLIEALLGRDREYEARVRAERGERYASRPIDIDIVFYGDLSFNDSRLTIPYHYLDERLYALRPVAEIAGSRQHPALELTPRQMLDKHKL